jgi:hypothetical protein
MQLSSMWVKFFGHRKLLFVYSQLLNATRKVSQFDIPRPYNVSFLSGGCMKYLFYSPHYIGVINAESFS